MQDFHNRISRAIDSGYIVDMNNKHIHVHDTVDGLNYLGNMIEGNADSVNHMYYGQLDRLYRKVFGLGPVPATKYNIIPTALDLFSTSMRDPMFYGMYKNIVTYWMRYRNFC